MLIIIAEVIAYSLIAFRYSIKIWLIGGLLEFMELKKIQLKRHKRIWYLYEINYIFMNKP